jgi:hypothetical protein
VLALVDDNQLEFGLSIEKAGANWVGIDNVNLYYLGAGNDAYQVFVNQKIGTVTDYESEIDEGNIKYYCHNDFDKYLAAKAALVSAQTKADISKAVTQFNNAYGSLSRSIDAYAEFLKLFKQAEGWLTAMDNSSDEANQLRRSHESPVMKLLYDEYFEAPGKEKAHKLLHTTYVKRGHH